MLFLACSWTIHISDCPTNELSLPDLDEWMCVRLNLRCHHFKHHYIRHKCCYCFCFIVATTLNSVVSQKILLRCQLFFSNSNFSAKVALNTHGGGHWFCQKAQICWNCPLTLDTLGQVTQVEDIVRLGRRWQQVSTHSAIYLHGRGNNRLGTLAHWRREIHQEASQDLLKMTNHSLVKHIRLNQLKLV